MGKIPGLPRKFGGMFYDIFTEAPHERPHLHVGRSPKHGKKSLKFWLDKMVFDDDSAGRYTVQELRDIVKFIKRNKDLCMEQWNRLNPPGRARR